MSRLAPDQRFDAPGVSTSQYRRGAVMGLTMAEAFVLIAFTLLLLLAVWKVQSDQEREAYRQELDAYRDVAHLGPGEIAAAARLAERQQIEAADDLVEQGFDLRRPEVHDLWRLVDQDELLRVMEAIEELPENLQRDLADLVEIQEADGLAVLLELTERASGEEALQARLAGIGRRLALAEEDERELVEALREELGSVVGAVGGTIDEDGAVVLPDTILFEQGRAEITPLMRNLLRQICEPWLQVLMEADAPVASALIEGHASREWRTGSSPDEAYLNNLALSQARSQAVLDACLRIVRSDEVRAWAHSHLAAVGYSSARPVMLQGVEDPTRSRRVVFSLRIDESKLLQDVATDVRLGVPAE